VDAAQRIYVTDAYQNGIAVFDNTGGFLRVIYDVGGPLRTPLGLAVGASNRVFVASLNTGVVEAYGIVPGVSCVTVTSAAAADDGMVRSNWSASWKPDSAGNVSTVGSSVTAPAHLYQVGQYRLAVGLLRFDTGSVLPDGAPIWSASLSLYVSSYLGARTVAAEYYDAGNWPIDLADWTNTAASDAHAGTAVNTLLRNRYNTFALQNIANISTTASMGFRLHFTEGTAPASDTSLTWAARDSGTNVPTLEVCYGAAPGSTPTSTITPGTPTPTPMSTGTPVPTGTPAVTGTSVRTSTPTPGIPTTTATPTSTATSSSTPVPPTATATVTPTLAPTATVTPSLTPTIVVTPTAVPTPVGPNKCLAGKTKCVRKKTAGLLNCHFKAERSGVALDAACVTKVKAKFDGTNRVPPDPARGCFERLEARENPARPLTLCLTHDDVGPMEDKVDAFVLDVVEDLDPNYPLAVTSACSAGKKKCVLKKVTALLKCREKCQKNLSKCGAPMETACEDKARAKFDGGGDDTKSCFAEAEGYADCLTPGGIPERDGMEAKADAFVIDVVNELETLQNPAGASTSEATGLPARH